MPGRSLKTATVLVLALTAAWLPADARNIWDINHGMSNPPTQPTQSTAPGAQEQLSADFWRRQVAVRIPAGTILTAILENDISSAKDKKGDTFALTLQDGFELNGKMMIPPFSKILGSVNFVAPARTMHNGMPGRIEISLQTLLLPDGRHMPIFANLEANPNSLGKKEPKIHQMGESFSDYGKSLASMGLSFVRGPGFMTANLNRGRDFKLEKGEAVPVRLTQDLAVPEAKPIAAMPPLTGAGTVMKGANINPAGPITYPSQGTTYSGGPTLSPLTQPDPNAIFNQPLHPVPHASDPF